MKVIGFILGCLLVVGGVYCIASPVVTFSILGWLFGLVMVVDGITGIFAYVGSRSMGMPSTWTLVAGIISLVLGSIVLGSIALQFALDQFFAYVVAFWLIFAGCSRSADAFRMRKLHNNGSDIGKNWGLTLATGILILIFGILCLVEPLIAAISIGIVMGLGVVSAGISWITLALNA